MSEPTTELLADWRSEYWGRRTVPYEMVRHLEGLVDAALKTQRKEHEAEVYRLQEERDTEVERLTKELGEMREKLAVLEAPLNESRVFNEDTVQVTIDSRQGGWRMGDLEDVAYRLRCGGADDKTPIEWREFAIRANVPAPNLVPLSPPSDVKPLEVRKPMYEPEAVFEKKVPGVARVTLARLANHPIAVILALYFVGVFLAEFIL